MKKEIDIFIKNKNADTFVHSINCWFIFLSLGFFIFMIDLNIFESYFYQNKFATPQELLMLMMLSFVLWIGISYKIIEIVKIYRKRRYQKVKRNLMNKIVKKSYFGDYEPLNYLIKKEDFNLYYRHFCYYVAIRNNGEWLEFDKINYSIDKKQFESAMTFLRKQKEKLLDDNENIYLFLNEMKKGIQ